MKNNILLQTSKTETWLQISPFPIEIKENFNPIRLGLIIMQSMINSLMYFGISASLISVILSGRSLSCEFIYPNYLNIIQESDDNVIFLKTLSAMAGFQTNISKCSERGVKLNFLIFFLIGASATKKVCKVKNFQV